MERGASVSIIAQDIDEGGSEHGLRTALGTLELAQVVVAVSGLFFSSWLSMRSWWCGRQDFG